MTDVLYVLGSGSKWKDGELRHSLRSLEAHCKDLGNVFIVGHCPSWVTNVQYIKHPDRFEEPERNTLDKTIVGCNSSALSEKFMKIDDDFFFLKDFTISDLPLYHKGNMIDTHKGMNEFSRYTKVFLNTIEILLENNLPITDYEVHNPVVYDKNLYVKFMQPREKPYCMKSVYFNQLTEVVKTKLVKGKDTKINKPFSLEQIQNLVQGHPFFSVGDIGLNNEMKHFIEKKYPVKSRYEL